MRSPDQLSLDLVSGSVGGPGRKDHLISFDAVRHVDDRAGAELDGAVGLELVHGPDAALGSLDGAPAAQSNSAGAGAIANASATTGAALAFYIGRESAVRPPSVYALLYTEGVSGGGSSRVACSVSQATGCLRLKVCSAPRGGDFAALPSWRFPLVFPDECRVCGEALREVSRVPVCARCLCDPQPLTAEFFCVACRTPFLNHFPSG